MHSSLPRRFMAFFIDSIVIAILGVILFYPISSIFIGSPRLHSFVTVVFASMYFAIFDSSLVTRFSLGKTLMKIKLVTKDGGKLPFWKSLLRTQFIFLLPLNQMYASFTPVDMGLLTQLFSALFLTVCLLAMISVIIFPLFHTHSRGIHDIFFGTYVVRNETNSFEFKKWSTVSLVASLLTFSIGMYGISKVVSFVSSPAIAKSEAFLIFDELKPKMNGRLQQFLYGWHESKSGQTATKNEYYRAVILRDTTITKIEQFAKEREFISNEIKDRKDLKSKKLIITLVEESFWGLFKFSNRNQNEFLIY